MRLISSIIRLGILFMGAIIFLTVSNASIWEESSSTNTIPSNNDLANSILVDWAFPLLVLGALLAMAMIGAAYLVRDERDENLVFENQRGEF